MKYEQKDQKGNNPHIEEIKKFIGKQVTILWQNPGGLYEVQGMLVSLDFNHMNCVIKTDTEKIIIKGFYVMRRDRSNPKK